MPAQTKEGMNEWTLLHPTTLGGLIKLRALTAKVKEPITNATSSESTAKQPPQMLQLLLRIPCHYLRLVDISPANTLCIPREPSLALACKRARAVNAHFPGVSRAGVGPGRAFVNI